MFSAWILYFTLHQADFPLPTHQNYFRDPTRELWPMGFESTIYSSGLQRGRNRPPGGDFVIYEIWGAISVSRGAISASRLKHTQMLNWFQKINICYFGIKAFDARSTPWFVTKVIKHISEWSRINQTTVTWFCETLHCTNYPRPLRLWLVGSQASRFSRRL